MKTLRRKTILLFVIGTFFSISGWNTLAIAQFSPSITGEAVSISLSPQYPNPEESVIATLDDYAIDATGASITWYKNGTEIDGSQNNRSITLKAASAGETTKIMAQLTFKNKPSIKTTVSITPVYVDVIVEPLTYTPVFYQGRALPVHGSLVNLTALIHNKSGLVSPALYTYNWQLNSKSVYGGPRTGNNRAQITVPYGRSSVVTLSVTDREGKLLVRRLIAVPSVEVDLEFYEVSTLYGLSQRALLGGFTLIGNSSTVRAVPFNLDNRAVARNLFTEWRINGVRTATNDTDPFEISLKRQGTGGATIGFKVRNLAELLQGDEQSFRVKF